MKHAQAKIEPILTVFHHQPMDLEHNLNARAVAPLKNGLGKIKSSAPGLVSSLAKSVNAANAFIGRWRITDACPMRED